MANITYTVNQDTPQSIPNIEVFSQEDTSLVNNFQVNQLFDSNKHSVELHIYNLAGELIESDYNYINYRELGTAASAGKEGASILTIDPVADVELYGYSNGDVKLLYNFVDDLYAENRSTTEFFIDSISPDRTELKLKTFNLTSEQILLLTSAIKTRLETQSYFNEFRINLLNNDLFIGVNIDTLQEVDDTSVVVKLYEPLPEEVAVKSTVSVVELVSDSVVYEVTSTFETEEVPALELRSPNFNLDLIDESVIPTGYYNYDTLLSLPISNTTNELYSLVNSKGVELSIDHNDYSNFVHFSSAQERLLNFKYKLDLIQSYNTQIANFQTVTTPSLGTTGSLAYYQGLVKGIVNNFDHYERFLYYESGSNSWPKTNSTKPYINDTTSVGDTWFNSKLTVAATYDATNTNILINSIPSYLRDDSSNASYITFIHMIGQHFDNMWVYAKGVSDKYNADNRLDFGVSRDLVAEVLKNFGVKLYTSNKTVEDLFSSFIGQPYQSGSEVINTYVTGSVTGSNASIQPSSFDNYQREVYKRMYHNLPLLLKSKGTERGLRALINCFGIPSDILNIKVYGGRNTNESPFYGDYKYYTSSLDKVRLDNTGSVISGSTLSQYTSTLKRDYKYTDDLHPIEIGFSPTDNVDNFISNKQRCTTYTLTNLTATPAYYSYTNCSGTLISNQGLTSTFVTINAIAGTVTLEPNSPITVVVTSAPTPFNIDNYIGDPRNLYLDDYFTFTPAGIPTGSLANLTTSIMSGSTAYDVQDFVRLIKFFDNTIFKMVKDFIPARSVADTGIIIKPHVLGRSKAKSVFATGSRPEYSGSIDTAFISGKSPNNFRTDGGEANTQYYDYPQTPTGIGQINSHFQEEAKYNGEISGSIIPISETDLNSANIYKELSLSAFPYQVNFVSASNEVCLLGTVPTPFYITSSTYQWDANQFFTFTNPNCVYSASNSVTSPVWTPITFPRPLPLTVPTPTPAGYYQDFLIKATNRNVISPVCTTNIQVRFATCSMYLSEYGTSITNVQSSTTFINLVPWFSNPNNQTLQYTASYGGTDYPITDPTQFQFNQPVGTDVTITVNDANLGGICKVSTTVSIGICTLGIAPKISSQLLRGFQFGFSEWILNRDNWSDTVTDPLTGETIQVNENYFGVAAKIRTIPQPTFGGGTAVKHIGIQSYFTWNNQRGTNVTWNGALRYNIYELKNKVGYNSSGYSNGYELKAIARGINPFTPPSTWNTYLGTNQAGLEGIFVNTAVVGTFYQPWYGYDSTPISYPIVLNAPFRNTPLLDEDQVNYFPVAILPTELVRGYVIEAYNINQPSCMQRTVVYGSRESLLTAEGPGTQPQFISQNILVNWNPTNGTPSPGYPTPYALPLGPWVETKVRTWGDTAIGTPP